MKPSWSPLSLSLALLAAPVLRGQDLSPRMGAAAFFTQPADSAARIYASGWKVDLFVHVRREALVEGRVRFELGEFSEGKAVLNAPAAGDQYSARTRLVGYDWLIPLGPKRETGVDLILGIGGAHWFRERTSFSLAGNPYPYRTSTSGSYVAFAGTVGFRFRLTRQLELEVHQVLTSLPGSQRDFEDAELSHTALGIGCRF